MGPFLKSDNKTSKIMLHLMIALMPIILFGVYKDGYIPYSNGKTDLFGLIYPLLFIIIGSLTTFLCETIYALITHKNVKDYIKSSYSFLPGLFLALVLPLKTPISVLIFGCLVASIVGKLIFGGFGKNIFNPALIGYVFIFAAFSGIFSGNIYLNDYEIDTISNATPLTNVKNVEGIGSYEELVEPYGGLDSFFVGLIPGSLGEVSSLLCIIAFCYLAVMKVIKWKIPVFYVGTVFIITCIIGRILGQGLYYPLFHILSGGLMFGSVFMATDPVTSPVTSVGQILYGMFLGILTVFLRFTGVEGVATSILIMNMFVVILDKIGAKSRFSLYKSVLWFFTAWLLIIVLGVYLAIGSKDTNFNIVSKNTTGSKTVYVASQKGYGGEIKAEVVIENDKVISYTVLSQHETPDRYKLVENSNYLQKLIDNQNKLSNVDTVSSATITSKALKQLLNNVLEDYR